MDNNQVLILLYSFYSLYLTYRRLTVLRGFRTTIFQGTNYSYFVKKRLNGFEIHR